MENRPCNRGQQTQSAPKNTPGIPFFTEPEVRRWPHPVIGNEVPPTTTCHSIPSSQADMSLHYIHCALSYQNQLLADIKTLLQQISTDKAEESVAE